MFITIHIKFVVLCRSNDFICVFIYKLQTVRRRFQVNLDTFSCYFGLSIDDVSLRGWMRGYARGCIRVRLHLHMLMHPVLTYLIYC